MALICFQVAFPLCIDQISQDSDVKQWLIYFSAGSRTVDYFIGFFLSLLWKGKDKQSRLVPNFGISCALFLYLFEQAYFEQIPQSLRLNAIFIPISMALLYFGNDSNICTLLENKTIVYMGNRSMYYYFIHWSILKYVHIVEKRLPGNDLGRKVIAIVVSFFVTMLVGEIMCCIDNIVRRRKNEKRNGAV